MEALLTGPRRRRMKMDKRWLTALLTGFLWIMCQEVVLGERMRREGVVQELRSGNHTISCRSDEFACKNGASCVDIYYKCDSQPDCADASDEENCVETMPFCAAGYHPCASPPRPGFQPACIEASQFCDNKMDCADGSDENECNFANSQDHQSSLHNARTPGRLNPNSPSSTQAYGSRDSGGCAAGLARCSDGSCIPSSSFCNSRIDCIDGSDEMNCQVSLTGGRAPYDTSPYSNPNLMPHNQQRQLEKKDEVKVKIHAYDTSQTVALGNDVVFRCRDESPLRIEVYWTRENDQPLPVNGNDVAGRLTITGMREQDKGVYVCHAKGYPDQERAFLNTAPARKPYLVSSTTATAETRDPYRTRTPRPELSITRPALLSQNVRMCPTGHISCRDGQCIRRSQVCDRQRDCTDGSDERSCQTRCSQGQFTCSNKCVAKSSRCDGITDCADGSDEFACPSKTSRKCGISGFKCSTQEDECIPWNYVCDEEYDCSDGSDEQRCVEPTMTHMPEKAIEVQRGAAVTLTCRASGYPKPSISWRFNMDRVPSTFSRINVCTACNNCTENEALSSLTLIQFEEGMEGQWTCEAVNAVRSTLSPHDTNLAIQPVHAFASGLH